jgi:hypothetical protein
MVFEPDLRIPTQLETQPVQPPPQYVEQTAEAEQGKDTLVSITSPLN